MLSSFERETNHARLFHSAGVQAVGVFEVVENVIAPEAGRFLSSVIDLRNSVAYFGTDTGQVCNYNISLTNFSFDSCVPTPSGAGNFQSAVMDAQNSVAFFGTSTSPAQVCMVNVSSSNFTFDSCITAPIGANDFRSAVIDPENSAAYFGTYTSPGQVCKVNISSTNFTFASCVTAAGGDIKYEKYISAGIVPQNSVALFSTDTSPGKFCSFDIAPTARFRSISCSDVPIGYAAFQVSRFFSSVIDVQNSAMYFGTSNFPGQVCKYRADPASSNKVTPVRCIAAPSAAGTFRSAVIDAHNSVAFFGTSTSPGQVCMVNVSSSNFAFDSCITAPGANDFRSAVIDPENSVAYFGTYTNPGRVVKIAYQGGFSCNPETGNLIITQDKVRYISRENQINIVALDQCNVTITDITVGFIEFRGAITNSNITIRNVTCTSESSPFCIKFFEKISSISSARSDFISISDVTFGVGSSFTSSTTLLHFAQTLTIQKATFSNLDLRDFAVTVSSGYLLVYGLHFQGLVTCPSLSITSISINNAVLLITVSPFTNMICIVFDLDVASGTSSSEPSSALIISNVSIVNCRLSIDRSGNRLISGIRFAGSTVGFEVEKISNVVLRDIDGGSPSINSGFLEFTNIRVDSKLSAPSSSSSVTTSLTIYNISAQSLRGHAGSGYAVSHSLRFGTVEHFSIVRISHIITSNITLTASGSAPAGITQLFNANADSFQPSSSTTFIHFSEIAVLAPVNLECASGSLSVIPIAFFNIKSYNSVIIDDIYVADENVVLAGGGSSSKTVIGVQGNSEPSINSAGGPSSSFLIHNITVPSPASTSSAHTSYAKTTENLFSRVNNFYNVTISHLSYLGELTVPSNLVSSGPVVFSILDSNATSILFNTAISDSNITVSGVRCGLNPSSFCVQFDRSLTNLGTLTVSRVEMTISAVANGVWIGNSINGINDTLTVEHVSLSLAHEMPNSFGVYAVAFAAAFTTTNVKQLTVTNIMITRSSLSATAGSRTAIGLALRESSSMKNILISNISIRDTNVTARDNLRLFGVQIPSGVSISAAVSSLESEPTSFIITNVSIVNCRFFRTGTGSSNRVTTGVFLSADVNGFEHIEISNILLQDIDAGMSLDNTGTLDFTNVRIDGTLLAAPSEPSTSLLTVSNITAQNLQGHAGASSAVAYSLRCPPSIAHFDSIRVSRITTANVTLKASGSVQVIIAQIYQFTANSLISSSSTTSLYISDITVQGPISLESTSGTLSAIPLSFKTITNYSLLTIENIHISGENFAMASSGKKDLHSIRLTPGSSISSASSTVVVRNVTVDSPSGVNSSLIHFDSNTLAEGTWNITSNNFTSPSSHLISAESTSIFSRTLTMNLRDNYIDITSDILSQTPPSFSLNSSTWNLICNRWSRAVYSRFETTVEVDSSNPRMNLQICLLTATKTASQSRPPTRTVIPTSSRTVPISSTISTPITATFSLSSTMLDSSTKTSELTPSLSITHETPSLSNSKSDVLISRLLRDAISQSVQNLGIAVTGIKGGSSATNARKIQAVVAMADCGKEDISDDVIPEIEQDSNPLALRIGSRRFDTYRGSIVGAFLFILLWGILMFTFAFIRTKIEYGCSLKRALRKVYMPGTLSAPGFCLLPVAVNSASAMMMRYKSPGYEDDSTMDLTIIAFGFVIGVFVPLGVLAWTIREVKRHEKLLLPIDDDAQDEGEENNSGIKKKKKNDKKQKKDKTNKNDELKDPAWKVWFDWLTEPRYKYKKTKFSESFSPLFDFVKFPVFIFLSFVVTIAMEIAEGASSLCPKGDRTCCHGGVVSMIALCSLDTLLILFYKIPFLVRIDYIVIPVCSVINVAMAALIYEMFQDSTSDDRMLASGVMIKNVGDENFDMSDEKKSSGLADYGSVVDHTETLVILSQVAFYLALASGLLGLLNLLLAAFFEVRAAYWSGTKKKLADLMDIDDLEEELNLMLAVDDKKEKKKVNAKTGHDDTRNQKNENSIGVNNNNDSSPPVEKKLKSTPEDSSPVRKRKRQLVPKAPQTDREQTDSSFGTAVDGNNNRSSPIRTKIREKPISPSPIRLSADALAKLNRTRNHRK